MDRIRWLIINYNLPTEPSRHRVSIWRALKKLGALNIQQSMWGLPSSEENYSALQKICKNIESNNGEALLMESTLFDEKHEKRVVKIYNNVRNDEYMEYIGECEKFIRGLKEKISKGKFTYAELEEEEIQLEKLISWYKKIEIRDVFNSSGMKEAKEMLIQIKSIFDSYSEMVFKNAIEREIADKIKEE